MAILNAGVVTTISPPTKTVQLLADKLSMFVVGDKKTPKDWSYPGVWYTLDDSFGFQIENHYARKNIGYLRAMQAGAALIYDTDDDNFPNHAWSLRQRDCEAAMAQGQSWCNVYKMFHACHVWPRGFSLAHVTSPTPELQYPTKVSSPIQQGLADGEPDVDAIWRLVTHQAWRDNFKFSKPLSVMLSPGTWCPFNSQTTWWWPEAYPLMYLPVYVPFRMTDIWRSFVAQRCLWEMGHGVVFHSPSEVWQDRNPHNLMHDFKDEVPGYLNNEAIVKVLTGVTLERGSKPAVVISNLVACYAALIGAKLIPADEERPLRVWIEQVTALLT